MESKKKREKRELENAANTEVLRTKALDILLKWDVKKKDREVFLRHASSLIGHTSHLKKSESDKEIQVEEDKKQLNFLLDMVKEDAEAAKEANNKAGEGDTQYGSDTFEKD